MMPQGRTRGDFNPRSPHGERHTTDGDAQAPPRFQPTLPARGATTSRKAENGHEKDFNPRSPHGERRASGGHGVVHSHFNPRSPHGERQAYYDALDAQEEISTHAPRTGSDVDRATDVILPAISTHAPRTGSDGAFRDVPRAAVISTHAPRTGSDSTLRILRCGDSDFNPRSPHGERPQFFWSPSCSGVFQPTLPARGATQRQHHRFRLRGISTHAPRTGSDAHCQLIR